MLAFKGHTRSGALDGGWVGALDISPSSLPLPWPCNSHLMYATVDQKDFGMCRLASDCSLLLPLQALKAAFTALMTADSEKVAAAISALVARLSQEQAGGKKLGTKEELVLRLNQQYPGDVGVLSAFFLNLVSREVKACSGCCTVGTLPGFARVRRVHVWWTSCCWVNFILVGIAWSSLSRPNCLAAESVAFFLTGLGQIMAHCRECFGTSAIGLWRLPLPFS